MSLVDLADTLPLDSQTVSELLARNENGESLFSRLYSIYVDEFPELMGELRAAWKASDGEAASEALHKMKGSSAAMGAMRMLKLSKAAMARCEDGTVFREQGLLAALEEEFALYCEHGVALK